MEVIKDQIPKVKFALALSGGFDSVGVCLYLKRHKHDFVCFHANNQLIPYDNEAQSKVEDLCKTLELELFVHTNEKPYESGSVEEFARKHRIRAFNELAVKTGIVDVISAHNLADAITSYLWCAFRGKIDHIPIPISTNFGDFTVRRPFVLAKKEELKRWVITNDCQNFVSNDPLNDNLALNRNFFGKKLLPLIQERNFNLERVVAKIMRKKILELNEKNVKV